MDIIFVHSNNNRYLPYVFSQVYSTNRNKNIWLLGNESTLNYPYIRPVLLKEYSKSADDFERFYIHLSTNPYVYELYCIKRWFIIKDFMKENDIHSACYIDSDVMVYSQLPTESSIGNFEISIIDSYMPSVSFISSQISIDNFCNWVFNVYKNRVDLKAKFYIKYNNHVKNGIPGGVCDMTLFDLYRSEYPDRVKDLGEIHSDNSRYDFTIDNIIDYNSENGIKFFKFIKKAPYCYNINLKKYIKFHTIHFQGVQKNIIYKYFKGSKIVLLRMMISRILFVLANRLEKWISKLRFLL